MENLFAWNCAHRPLDRGLGRGATSMSIFLNRVRILFVVFWAMLSAPKPIAGPAWAGPNASAGCALDLDCSSLDYDCFVSDADIDSRATASVGEDIFMIVVAQNVVNLDTYQVEVDFDPEKLAFIQGYEENTFAGIVNILKENGGSTVGFQAVERVPGNVNIGNALVGSNTYEAPECSGVLGLLRFVLLDDSRNNRITLSNVKFIDSNGYETGEEDEISILGSGIVNALILYVAEDIGACPDGEQCYRAIGEAVDSIVEDGAVLIILPGDYPEDVTIDKSVTVIIQDGPVYLGPSS